MALGYALLLIVAGVPITPMYFLRVAETAAEAPASMTLRTGTDESPDITSIATAAIVLHATIRIFTPLFEKKIRDLARKPADRFDRFDSIRDTGGVAKIDDILERKPLHQGADNRQPANSGIEYPDRVLSIRFHLSN